MKFVKTNRRKRKRISCNDSAERLPRHCVHTQNIRVHDYHHCGICCVIPQRRLCTTVIIFQKKRKYEFFFAFSPLFLGSHHGFEGLQIIFQSAKCEYFDIWRMKPLVGVYGSRFPIPDSPLFYFTLKIILAMVLIFCLFIFTQICPDKCGIASSAMQFVRVPQCAVSAASTASEQFCRKRS